MNNSKSIKEEPIIKEVLLNAPVSKVWKALTDSNEMKNWYFDIPEFKPEVGRKFQFYGGTEEKQYLHLCQVTEVIPEKKLTHSWNYDGYAGRSFVTFELTPQGEKTEVTLTHKGLETFPADNPDLKKENFMEGWNSIIGTSLKAYVEKK